MGRAADHHFGTLEQNAVQFFSDERHHRVQEVKHVLQHVAEEGHGVLLFCGQSFAVDHSLLDFKVLAANVIPHEAVEEAGHLFLFGRSPGFAGVGLYFNVFQSALANRLQHC